MKVFVTGATGFVGSHLCDLLSKKNYQVFSLARSIEKFQEFDVAGKPILGSLSSREKNKWIEQLPDDLDIVIHVAGLVHTFKKELFYEVNTQATKQLLEDLSQKYKRLKFVFISSLSAAGPSLNGQERNEDFPLEPVSHYGKSKMLAEKELLDLNVPSWEKVIIRPPMVIGPRDPAFLDIVKMVKNGHFLNAGAPSSKKLYSFVCVFDLIEMILKALETDFYQPETFYSCYPQPVSLSKLITLTSEQIHQKKVVTFDIPLPILKVLSYLLLMISKVFPINLRLTPDKYEEIAPNAWTCSSEKSQKFLKMSYQWDIKKSLEKTCKDYMDRHWL